MPLLQTMAARFSRYFGTSRIGSNGACSVRHWEKNKESKVFCGLTEQAPLLPAQKFNRLTILPFTCFAVLQNKHFVI